MPKVSEPITTVKPQACLSFVLERQVSTEEWRTLLASWLVRLEPGSGLEHRDLHAAFHHQSDGRPATGIACLRFHSSANTGRVYALGDEAVATVCRIAAAIAKSKVPGLWLQPPMLHMQEVSIAPAGQAVTYSINDLVICRYAEQYKRWCNSSRDSRLLHVQDVVKRGLERQVDAMGMRFSVPSPQVLSVGHERAVPKLRRPGTTKAFVRLASVFFTLPVALDGHWVAGGLANRGYGRIVAF